jgi:hypothetical protein
VHVDEPIGRYRSRRAGAEEFASAVGVDAVDTVHEAHVEIGCLAQQLEEKRVLGRAGAAAFGEHPGWRLVVVASERDRPDALDDRDQVVRRQRLASGSSRNARS